MKRFLLALLLASGVTYADTTTNLITSPLSPTVPATAPGGFVGGYQTGYNSSTNTYYFGYVQNQIGQTWAINQALSSVGAGVQISGFSYGFQFLNGGDSYGTLVSHAYMTDAAGNVNLQEAISWSQSPVWQTINRTVTYNTIQDLADVGYGGLYFTGKDSRFWAGYYGPQVKDPYYKVNYSVDPCITNPRYSPSCPGYSDVWSTSDLTSIYGTSFAINQALGFGNSGVRVHSATWGYDYSIGGRWCSGWSLFGICLGWSDSYVGGSMNVTNNSGNQIAYDINSTSGENISGSFRREVLLGNTSPDISTLGNANINVWSGGIASVTPYMRFNFTPDVCSSDPLVNPSCPGYQQAYLDLQCSFNALYSTNCSGYAAAYHTQQCSLNSLYSPSCPGYAAAYLNYQCSVNPLYSTTCVGYEQAYFDQQCSLDGLYSNQCPNYAEAYAKKNILNIGSTTTTTTVETTTTTVAIPTVSSDGTVKTEVSKTGDSTVDSVISNTTTSATSTTATVQLAPAPTQSSPSQTVGAVVAEQKQEQKQENKNDASGSTKENNSGSSNTQSAQTSGDKKEGTKTARQELQEKREAAVKAKAVEEGKQLAGKVGEAASMEAQVAVQNVLIAAMGYTPGFQTYSIVMPDVPGYKPFTVYKNQKNVDNARMMRGLSGASDRLHEELVSLQYK
jgi:hypothetical protein